MPGTGDRRTWRQFLVGEATSPTIDRAASDDSRRQAAVLRTLTSLSRVNEQIVRADDEAVLLQQTCEAIVESGGYPLAWFGRPLDDDERSVVAVAVAGVQTAYLDEVRFSWGDGPLGQGPTGVAIRTGTTQVRQDLQADPAYYPWVAIAEAHGLACSVALPVVVRGSVAGVLGVWATETGSFDDVALGPLEDLVTDLGVGIERIQVRNELRRSYDEIGRSAARMRATLDSQLDPFMILESVRDESGRLVDLRCVEANQAAALYNRMSREELLGTTLLTLFPALDSHGPLSEYFRTIETGQPMILDDVLYANEILGEVRSYDLRGVRLDDGLALTWRDSTERRAAAQALETSRAEFLLLAENASDFVLRTTVDRVIDWASPSVERMLGLPADVVVGHRVSDFLHPDHQALGELINQRLAAGETVHDRVMLRDSVGSFRWFDFTSRPVCDGDGTIVARVSSWRQVEAEVAAQRALAASESLFRSAMRAAAIGMALADLDGRFRVVNEAMCRLVQHDEAWLLEHSFLDMVHPDDRELVLADRVAMISGAIASSVRQHRLVRADGAVIWVRRAGVVIRDHDGEPDFIMVQIEDVTSEREAVEKLAFQAFHDPVTGLRNRAWLIDTLEADLASAQREGRAVGVLFVDLDNFKMVNESLGHTAGDEMLATIGHRIAGALPAGDRVGRFGGDEFVVVVPDVRGRGQLEAVAAAVTNAVVAPLVVRGHGVVAAASIGMAVSTTESTAASLLRDADAALFHAKAAGRSRWQIFDSAMHLEAVNRLTVEDELRRGIAQGELIAHYQPIVDLGTSAVVGHEALVRWAHPSRGVLAPAAFLGVAEESGLVVEVGQAVLEQVCARIVVDPDLRGPISVNVSAVQLARADWADGVITTLERHQVDPSRLVLEVTETSVLSLLESTRNGLLGLRERGVGLHVDDFGTGYSSVAVLRDLPVSGLKLDRSFVSDLTAFESPANALSRGLASLASSLHIVGIAEGIETVQQAEILREHGWPHGQGFLFGRPAPVRPHVDGRRTAYGDNSGDTRAQP